MLSSDQAQGAQARFFARFAQCGTAHIGIAVDVTAELQPAIELAMVQQHGMRALRIDDPRRRRDVSGCERAVEGRTAVLLEKRDEPLAHLAFAPVMRHVRAHIIKEFRLRPEHHVGMSPLVTGALLAIASAVAFGATAPLIGHFGAGLRPWSVAALLYLGAALATRPTVRSAKRERSVATRDLSRIIASGVLGAMLAPAALAWGIAHTGALSASLVLALESVFTIAIAAVIFREHIDARVAIAATLIAAGALALASGTGGGSPGALGIAAVAAATLLWAIDNAITGTIAGADPSSVVVLKSTTGIIGSLAVALLVHEPLPALYPAIALLATGAIGFGASLRWYLLAQRTFGVARTASLFAIAPFAGAAIAFAFGERAASLPVFGLATVLIAIGVALHLSERHEHRHGHTQQRHVHAHTHDDGHHDHAHAAVPGQPHSHEHMHAARIHAHPHAPDEHHAHTHGAGDDAHPHEHAGGQAFGIPKPS